MIRRTIEIFHSSVIACVLASFLTGAVTQSAAAENRAESLQTPNAGAENDIILNAVSDEMSRTLNNLHSESHPKPYFLSYIIRDVDLLEAASVLGSRAEINRSRSRILDPTVKIGEYKFDSSFPVTSQSHYFREITTDDLYPVLRQAIWLETDREYKNAVTTFEWKKAYLASNNVPDRLDDLTKEKPLVSIKPLSSLPDDKQKWSDTIQRLSSIFLRYPKLQESKVLLAERRINTWVLNNEGTRERSSELRYELLAWCSAQAKDGMKVTDYECFCSFDPDKMLPFEQMASAVEALGQRVSDLTEAPIAEDYCGPVLFQGQAAAELVSQVLAPCLGFAEDYVGTETWRNPLKNSIGRRILPKYISVSDNPAEEEFEGKPLFGGWKIDEDGVPAQKVVLVENGILKNFCQSRLPTKHSLSSNGHSMGGHGVYSILKVTSSKTSTPAELQQQLADLAKDSGLDYVLIVERLSDEFHPNRYPPGEHDRGHRSYATPSYSRQLSEPVIAYRFYLKDGHKELVRGLEFKSVSLRAFKDIQAVGKDAQPYLVEPSDYMIRDLITPSLIIGELELSPVKSEHVAPPKMESPVQLAAEKAQK